MQNQVRRDLPQVAEHGFKSAPVAMDIGNDRDSHGARRLCNDG
jgi:hypothetical protein